MSALESLSTDSPAVALAKQYFSLSNKSDMAGIRAMMRDSTTYSSANTGVYLGVEAILEMQTAFHTRFATLNWDVHSIDEERPGVVRFTFTFSAGTHEGEELQFDGVEYVIIHDGHIQHIEVRNA